MKTEKLLSWLLTLALLASLLCAAAPVAAETEVSDAAALAAALEAGGEVRLGADVAVPEDTRLIVPADVSAALDLAGFTLKSTGREQYAVLVRGELTVTDSSAEGAGRIEAQGGTVLVYEGGSLTVSGGTVACTLDYSEVEEYMPAAAVLMEGASLTIAGGTVSAPGGTAVYVPASEARMTGGTIFGGVEGVRLDEGRFELFGGTVSAPNGSAFSGFDAEISMSGGTVCDSYSGFVLSGGSLVLSGGTVSGNLYDGVDLFNGAAFTMTGGTVSGSGEDGVWIDSGSFDFSGGAIADCLNEGVDIHTGTVTMSGGAITGSGTSGVVLREDESFFRMTDGAISGSMGYFSPEDDRYHYGSGVELEAGAAEIAGGEILDCVYGVCNWGDVRMSGGVIRGSRFGCMDEEANWFYGGSGIATYGGLTMTGGTISDCDMVAIDIYEGGSAVLSGGTLSGCGWGGVYLGEDGALTLSGSPVFTDNWYDILMAPGVAVTLGGPLDVAAPLSLYLYDAPDGGAAGAVLTSGLSGSGSAADFTLSDPDYALVTDADGEVKAVYIGVYPDVRPGAWYVPAVAYVTERGIMQGTNKGFEPQKQMTKAMAAQVIWNFCGRPETEGALPYDDTEEDAWYAPALRWAVENGVADAESASFDPNAPITREDLCVMCYRCAQLCGKGFRGLWAFRLDFPDAADLSDGAREAMSWFVMTGVINGMSGKLNPQGTATRAQAATILMRLAQALS